MAVTATDGGGTPKPTSTSGTTPTGGSGRGSAPAGTTTGGAGPRPTAFTRRPVVDDNLSLGDVLRTRKPATTPTATSTTPAPTTAAPDDKNKDKNKNKNQPPAAARPLKSPIAAPASPPQTANDGRAENLNSGNHTGSRDERIRALRETQANLEQEETEIEGRIDDLEEEIGTESAVASGIKTGVGIVTAPVGAIAGLFGKENPVAAGAEALTNRITGLEGDKQELEDQEEELDAQQAEIEAEIRKLENEQVLNFMADTAHVVDMDAPVADFLENGTREVGDLDVRLQVADGTGSGSAGVFDAADNTITVDEAILEDARENMETLQRQGVVDGDGNIVNAQAFDRSEAGDAVIKTVSTIGVHEVNHAVQHAEDRFAPAFAAKVEVAKGFLADLIGEDGITDGVGTAVAVTGALVAGETERSRQVEVESYRLQEQNDLRSGATKKAFITVDEQGNPLPEDQQLANVMAYQAATPLPYGPSAGYERAGAALDVAGIVGDEDEHGHSHDDGHDHGGTAAHDLVAPASGADGLRGPGLRGPALNADGLRGPGLRGPGLDADGLRGPGLSADALVANALEAAGLRGPGTDADGLRGPGLRGPGLDADGLRGPGLRGPGLEAAGLDADGLRGPGLDADGLRGPGLRGPGLTADAIIANALIAAGLRGPGLDADGLRGPGIDADGLRGPGLRGPGLRGPGLDADGLRGPGLDADGLRGPGLRGPGLTADALLADALIAAGLMGDGLRGPGLRGPGLDADGLRGPGLRGPGLDAA